MWGSTTGLAVKTLMFAFWGSVFLTSAANAVVGPRQLIPRLSLVEETEIHIFKDHRSRIKAKGTQKIQTEDGKAPKIRLLSFDKNQVRVNTFKAWTINGSRESEVPSAMIQWTPVFEEAGFSTYVSIEVAFPRMNVGSQIRWEYEIEDTQIPLMGFFSYMNRLDSDFHASEGFRFKVTSEVPLIHWNIDPQGVFQINSSEKSFEAKLKKSISHFVINENYGIISLSQLPSLFVSTAPKWQEVGAELQKKYELRLQEPMTPLLKDIANKIKNLKGFAAQAAEMNRLLRSEIRYMGDWRGRYSGHVPRSIAAISSSQFGDCKDFSLMATKILRHLGYKAFFASVYSDRIPAPDAYYQSPHNYFNHQIVYVKVGKVEYWLDPTAQSEVTMMDDTLANRKALVWEQKPQLRRIAGYQQSDNGFRYRLVMTPLDFQRFAGDLEIESWGLESKFAKDDEDSQNPMLRWMMTFFPDVKATAQEFQKHTPRLKKPWAHRVRGLGTFEDLFDRTPMGDGLRMGYSGFTRAILDVNEDWISDFDFGFPSERRYDVEFKGRQFLLTGGESCKIKSPWLNIEVGVKNLGGSGHLSYKETFKVTEITNTQLKSDEFSFLQSQIKNCLASRILILQKPPDKVAVQKRGTASEGMTVRLKKVASPTVTTKYHGKKLTPLRNPLPPRRSTATNSVSVPKSSKKASSSKTSKSKKK